uniref:SFRICE_028297 n=1 Tax=Spodoptera frugiperda TaxID=7108 RepID=A0A2H1WNB7_SPOFR
MPSNTLLEAGIEPCRASHFQVFDQRGRLFSLNKNLREFMKTHSLHIEFVKDGILDPCHDLRGLISKIFFLSNKPVNDQPDRLMVSNRRRSWTLEILEALQVRCWAIGDFEDWEGGAGDSRLAGLLGNWLPCDL